MSHGGDVYRNKVNMDYSVNLNPLGAQEEVLSAMRESIKRASDYPDLEQDEVREVLADSVGLDKKYIFAGNGASELLMAIARTINPKETLLFEPVYSGYEYVLNSSIKRCELKEEEGFLLTSSKLDLINVNTDLIFICDPVNPTGKNVDDSILIKLIDKAKNVGSFVCIDESFLLMSEKADRKRDIDLTEIVKQYDNLIIIRSLTKFLALPGIRMGYVISAPQNIENIRKNLPEWNLSVMSEAAIKAGIRLIDETDFISRTTSMIREEREFLKCGLKALGLKVFDSDTSFVFFKGPETLYKDLLEKNVLIRDCSDFAGLKKGFYRIAVKTHAENEKFIEVLKGVVDYS